MSDPRSETDFLDQAGFRAFELVDLTIRDAHHVYHAAVALWRSIDLQRIQAEQRRLATPRPLTLLPRPGYGSPAWLQMWEEFGETDSHAPMVCAVDERPTRYDL